MISWPGWLLSQPNPRESAYPFRREGTLRQNLPAPIRLSRQTTSRSRNAMTLVVAQCFASEIRIVSDTHLTPVHALHRTILDGALKCITVSPSVCICYAGNVELATDAIRPILERLPSRRADVVDHLLQSHRQHANAVDFLVAFADEPPTICRVAEGALTYDRSSAWIGEYEGFCKFQEAFNSPSVGPSSSTHEAGNWSSWVGRMADSMSAVIDDPNVRTVGGYVVTATSQPSERDGFRYLPRLYGSGFHEVALTDQPTSVVRPVGAEGGGYRYSLLVPNAPGVSAVGVYIPEALTGVLLGPVGRWTATTIKCETIASFITTVQESFGITLVGPFWGSGAV